MRGCGDGSIGVVWCMVVLGWETGAAVDGDLRMGNSWSGG
jgi:hypothetical protein